MKPTSSNEFIDIPKVKRTKKEKKKDCLYGGKTIRYAEDPNEIGEKLHIKQWEYSKQIHRKDVGLSQTVHKPFQFNNG